MYPEYGAGNIFRPDEHFETCWTRGTNASSSSREVHVIVVRLRLYVVGLRTVYLSCIASKIVKIRTERLEVFYTWTDGLS